MEVQMQTLRCCKTKCSLDVDNSGQDSKAEAKMLKVVSAEQTSPSARKLCLIIAGIVALC